MNIIDYKRLSNLYEDNLHRLQTKAVQNITYIRQRLHGPSTVPVNYFSFGERFLPTGVRIEPNAIWLNDGHR